MKINVIKPNAHKYSISAMCAVLQISRSTYYYEYKQKQEGLVSNYTVVQYKQHVPTCNEDQVENVQARKF